MKKNLKESIYRSLFSGKTEIDPISQRVKVRLETGFTKWLADPALPDNEIRKFLMAKFKISYSQATRDIRDLKFMLGNVSNAAKEWQRYLAIDMIKKAYHRITTAKDRLDVKIGEGMVKSALGICKVTNLGKEDPEPLDWDKVIPQSFEITDDITELGLKKIPNLKEYQAKMRKKYGVMDSSSAED